MSCPAITTHTSYTRNAANAVARRHAAPRMYHQLKRPKETPLMMQYRPKHTRATAENNCTHSGGPGEPFSSPMLELRAADGPHEPTRHARVQRIGPQEPRAHAEDTEETSRQALRSPGDTGDQQMGSRENSRQTLESLVDPLKPGR